MLQNYSEEADRILGMRQMQKNGKYMDLLLNRSSELGMTDVATMETNNICVGNGAFVVVVFTICQESIEAHPGDTAGSRGQAMTFLTLAVNEIMTDRYLHFAADVGGRMACLLCFPMETPASERLAGIQNSIPDACREIEAFCWENFSIKLFYVISQMQFGMKRIERAYGQCRDILEYFQFQQKPVPGEIFESGWNLCHDERGENRVYARVAAQARQLAQAVISENEAGIREVVDAWISDMFSTQPYTIRCLHNRSVLFFTQFLSKLVEADYTDPAYIDEACFTTGLLEKETKREYCEYVDRTVALLMAHARKRREFSAAKRVDDARQYVDEHFTEVNISVSGLADLFGLSQPLLSTYFKQYTGTGLSDYIHRQRISMAQELIASTDLPLQEISDAVGYTCLVTMYRAFRKYEGVAPGQLRKR